MCAVGDEQVRVRFIQDFTSGDALPIAAGSELVISSTTADALTLAGMAVRLKMTSSV